MAHRPIAIDGAGADGSAEGAVDPCPSNDHGGDGACIDQVVVPTAPPRPSARDKDAVSHRVVSERRLPKPPKSQHWVRKHFMVYAKEALANIAVCRICEANCDVDNAEITSFVESPFIFSSCSFCFSLGSMRSPRVLL